VLQELPQSGPEQDGVSLSVFLGENLQVPLRVALFVLVELVDGCCCFPLVEDRLQFLRPERHDGGCCGSFSGLVEEEVGAGAGCRCLDRLFGDGRRLECILWVCLCELEVRSSRVNG
jgi:hypothetical protein